MRQHSADLLIVLTLIICSGCACMRPSVRQASVGMNVELQASDKARALAVRVDADYTLPGVGIVARQRRPGVPLRGHLEATAHALAAHSLAYAATEDRTHIEVVDRILAGLTAMDEANTLDGYFPRIVTEENGRLTVVVDKTKANAVSQLIVALWLAWAEIPSDETVAAATRHIRRIAERYARYNYLLVDGEGRAVEHSDLGAVWSPSNLLDRLLLLELGSQMLYGEPIGDRLRADLQQYTEDPPRVRLNLLHVRASVVELPTASSDFLHVWALYALCRATQSPHYKQALRRLLRQTRGQRNPLFHAVGIGCGVIDPDQQAIVNFGLTTYPAAQLTDVPVSNSSDRDVPRKWLPRVVKNEFEREARRPLPVWRRPLTWFEWKRNQLRLDGNSGADGQTEFSGGDYLLLYWLAARHRIGVAGDRYRR